MAAVGRVPDRDGRVFRPARHNGKELGDAYRDTGRNGGGQIKTAWGSACAAAAGGGGEDFMEISGLLALEERVEPLRPCEGGIERGLVVKQPGLEECVLGIQLRCVSHQQPGQPISTRNRPDRRQGTCRRSALFRRVAAALAQPVPHGSRSPAEAELHQLAPELGRVAASFVPTARQEVDELIGGTLDVDHDSAVTKAVQQGCRDHGIAEDLPPFGEAAVGGQGHGAAFVAGIDQLEEQVAGTGANAEAAAELPNGIRAPDRSRRHLQGEEQIA